MLEKDLHSVYEGWILDSYSDSWIYKSNDRSTSGIPDIHATTHDGTIWIELKHNHKLSKLQLVTLLKQKKAGAIALVGKDYMICRPEDYDMFLHEIPKDLGWNIKQISLRQVIKEYDKSNT